MGIEIAKDVKWLMTTKKFKHSEKEKMAKLFTINSNDYISILCKEYNSKKGESDSIQKLIDTKYGTKSQTAQYLKDRIKVAQNKNDFFVQKTMDLGSNKTKFKQNQLEILYIFLSGFQTDLNQIRLRWNNRNSQKMRDFLKQNGGN